MKELTRRDFLRLSGMTTVGVVAVACTPATPPVVEGEVSADESMTQACYKKIVMPYWITTASCNQPFLFVGDNETWVSELWGSLLWMDPKQDNKVSGSIAESFTVNEDATEWTFTIREGAKWHDGEPVTVDDVLFDFDVYSDPQCINRAGKIVQQHFDSWSKVDERTLKLNLKKPHPALGLDISRFIGLAPKHVYEADPFSAEHCFENNVGAGPFYVENWDNQKTVFKKFADYWNPSKIDEVVHVESPWIEGAAQVRAAMMETGQTNYSPWWNKPALQPLVDSGNFNTCKAIRPDAWGFIMDLRLPWWQDKRVRQAMRHIVDWRNFNAAGTVDREPPTGAGIGFEYGEAWVNPKFRKPFEPDFDQGVALLEEVGWKDEDGDGILEAHGVAGIEDDTKFEFTSRINSSGGFHQESLALQQMLGDVGIKMNLSLYADAEEDLVLQAPPESSYVIQSFGVSYGPRPIDRYANYVTTDEVQHAWGANRTYYSNPEYDRLVAEGMATTSEERLKEIVYRLQEIWYDEVPAVETGPTVIYAVMAQDVICNMVGPGLLWPLQRYNTGWHLLDMECP